MILPTSYCRRKFIIDKTASLIREDDIFPYIKNVCVKKRAVNRILFRNLRLCFYFKITVNSILSSLGAVAFIKPEYASATDFNFFLKFEM